MGSSQLRYRKGPHSTVKTGSSQLGYRQGPCNYCPHRIPTVMIHMVTIFIVQTGSLQICNKQGSHSLLYSIRVPTIFVQSETQLLLLLLLLLLFTTQLLQGPHSYGTDRSPNYCNVQARSPQFWYRQGHHNYCTDRIPTIIIHKGFPQLF
jgi:hypothetical protein